MPVGILVWTQIGNVLWRIQTLQPMNVMKLLMDNFILMSENIFPFQAVGFLQQIMTEHLSI